MADEKKNTSGVPDGWVVVEGGKSKEPAPASDASVRPSVSARVGVPAAGRGTQLDVGRSQAGAEWAVTPLGHPTGVDAVDQFTSPVGLASLAAGGAGIAASGAAGGAGAAVRATAAAVAPIAKYEVVKAGLTSMGVPHLMASAAAALVTGYKRGAAPAAAETEEAAAAASRMDRSVPMRPSAMTQQEIADRVLNGSGTPPPRVTSTVAPPPRPRPAVEGPPAPTVVPSPEPVVAPPAAAAMPGAASEVRPVVAPAVVKASGKMKLTADEFREFQRLTKSGMTQAEAEQFVKLARQSGAMTDSEVQTALDARHASGQAKTPSAQTARARRSKS